MSDRLNFDLWLIGPLIVLLLISIIILESIFPQDIVRHLLFTLLGIASFTFFSLINIKTFKPLSIYIYIFSVILLISTFIFGEVTRGSVRWIRLGSINIQTSEIIKPLMIFTFASLLSGIDIQSTYNKLIYFGMLLFPVVLIFNQPDLGSAMVLTFVGLSMAFAAGISFRFLFALTFTTASVLPFVFKLLKPYQQERILSFINPLSDPLGSGYNVIQSLIAVGSGKIFGRGLGHGTQSQLEFIPERQSDFIFASLAEELGFIGVSIILICYFIILNRLINYAKNQEGSFEKLILVGVFSMIFFQVTVNIGMNIGLLPITGITLPLISSGGSSQIAVLSSLGMAQSIIKRMRTISTIEIH